MKLLTVAVACITLSSVSSMASELTCENVSKKTDGCFLNGSKKMTVKVTKEKFTITDGKLADKDNLNDVVGTFEKTVEKTGDAQYTSDTLVGHAGDQTDLGKIFVSADESTVTLSIRFTDDDGPQSFENCVYSCK